MKDAFEIPGTIIWMMMMGSVEHGNSSQGQDQPTNQNGSTIYRHCRHCQSQCFRPGV